MATFPVAPLDRVQNVITQHGNRVNKNHNIFIYIELCLCRGRALADAGVALLAWPLLAQQQMMGLHWGMPA